MKTQGIKKITPKLHHIGLTTGRFEEMVEWYKNVLEMEPVHYSENPAGDIGVEVKGVWVTNDEANHRIAIMGIPGLVNDENRSKHSRLQHMAFEYDTLDDLLDTYVRLKKIGIKPHFTVDQGVSIAFYYDDPDGNTLELTMDTFGDWNKSTEYMKNSSIFAKKPMGKYVDVEKLLEAREQGISSNEIHERAYAGEYEPDTPMDPTKML
ncbi:VOC family protein [Peribacillus frigoritolerans]|uniref:VOC family protein n=1 Tax=Peribacillus frigoritolerans TaxID=450367 RepID=UPI0039A00206